MFFKKKIVNLIFIIVICSLFTTLSCDDDDDNYQYSTYTAYRPVYMPYDELRQSVNQVEAKSLENTGKIYIKDNYIFINEIKKGIHIIDNSNPSNPQIIAFVNIPGNVDIAVIGNIMYADSYVDLVTLDITDVNNVTEVKRIENIFPYNITYEYKYPLVEGVAIDETQGVIVDWAEEEVVKKISYYDDYYITAMPATTGTDTQNTSGVGGSMARFIIYSNYLYCINNTSLQLINISIPSDPMIWSNRSIGWGIETLYILKDKLFIGSQTGMYIYDIDEPDNPQYLSLFSHASACDPVVAQGDYAYVTLRGGTRCAGYDNQLDVLDISDLQNPTLIKSYNMQGPYGLGIDGTSLFICDGIAGLKSYNANDPLSLQLIEQIDDFETYDVIPYQNRLHIIGNDGFYQYSYENPAQLEFISSITIN